MGSTVVQLYLTQAFRLEYPPFFHRPSEFLNRPLWDDVEEFRAHASSRIAAFPEQSSLSIKVHINHLEYLTEEGMFNNYFANIQDFATVVMLRKNITDKILSQCIAEMTQEWVGVPNFDNKLTVESRRVKRLTLESIKHYNQLVHNHYNLAYASMFFYEDFLNDDLRDDICVNKVGAFIDNTYAPEAASIKVEAPSDKLHLIDNYDASVDIINAQLTTHAEFDYDISDSKAILGM